LIWELLGGVLGIGLGLALALAGIALWVVHKEARERKWWRERER
jgi:hypothetical protein